MFRWIMGMSRRLTYLLLIIVALLIAWLGLSYFKSVSPSLNQSSSGTDALQQRIANTSCEPKYADGKDHSLDGPNDSAKESLPPGHWLSTEEKMKKAKVWKVSYTPAEQRAVASGEDPGISNAELESRKIPVKVTREVAEDSGIYEYDEPQDPPHCSPEHEVGD